MSNKLEEFVKANRAGFDVSEPSAKLWHKIEAGVNAPAAAGKTKWLKYLVLGAPATALCLYLLANAGSVKKQPASSPVAHAAAGNVMPAANARQHIMAVNYPAPKQAYTVQVKNEPAAASVAITNDLPGRSTDSLPPLQANFVMRDVTGINTPFRVAVENDVVPEPAAAAKEEPQRALPKGANEVSMIDTLFSGIRTLDITATAFDVDIRSHAGNDIFFKASAGSDGGKDRSKFLIRYEKKDSTLFINIINKTRQKKFGMNVMTMPALRFEVPEATGIIVNAVYGNVDVRDLSGKACNIRASSGNVNIRNINASVSVGAMHGNISVKELRGNLSAVSGSGDLSITAVTGNLDIKSTHGSQVLNNINGRLYSVALSGDIHVLSMQGDLHVTASHGSTTLENYTGSPVITSSSGDIKGRNVTLTGNMKVTSEHGSVDMALVNELAQLSFDLQTVHGHLSIEKNGEKFSNEQKLLTGKGKFQVTGSTVSGDQHYR